MRRGRIAGSFGRGEATEENVIACATGAGQEGAPEMVT